MKLTQWKGGGIAGEKYSVQLGEIDVGSLPRPQAGEIAELIDECDFFALPNPLPPGESSQTDPHDYRLRVTDGARTHQLDWNDNSAVSGALQRLTDVLSDMGPWVEVPWPSWHDGQA